MTPRLDEPEDVHGPMDAVPVRERLEAIEDSLLAKLTDERRYGSGVSARESASDLEFIQMTGLTRPFTVATPQRQPQSFEEAAPLHTPTASPVDFFERGVADVDHSAGPPGLESTPPQRSAPTGPAAPDKRGTQNSAAKSADALRDLIADLTRTGDESPPEEIGPNDSGDAGRAYEDAEIASVMGETSGHDDFVAGNQPAQELQVDQPMDTALLHAQGGHLNEIEEPPPTLEDLLEEARTDMPEADTLFEQTQSVTADEISVSNLPWPQEPPDTAPPVSPEQRLSEAEELLEALERQPREDLARQAASTEMPISPLAHDTEAAEEFSGIIRTHGSQRRVYRRSRRGMLRKAAVAICLVIAGGAAYYGYRTYVAPITVSADTLYAQAAASMHRGDFEQAAGEWRLLTQRFPEHPGRAEAQFQAAFAYFLARPSSDDESRDFARRAVALFSDFIEDNPGHAKAPRAACLVGILHYRLQQYDRAVKELLPLCEQPRPSADPEALLPAMRTLARSYSRLGDYVASQQMYEAAASLERNFTPEVDYYELGTLFLERARIAAESGGKLQLMKQAAGYWESALRAPGLDPQERDRIRTQRNALLEQIKAARTDESDAAAALEGGSTAPVADTTAADAPATAGPMLEPSPYDEAQQLLNQGVASPEE